MSRIKTQGDESGLLLFTGAGISMAAPSCLPNWYQFNEAVLRGLADSLVAATKPRLGEWMFGELLAARNKEASTFAPDYIADIIAEEAGADYFRIVQTIDAPDTNASHRAIAALAGAGLLKAYVTTNFDCLVERALEAAKVPFRVYASPASYAELLAALKHGHPQGVLPVIKVHGTAGDPDSIVDTLSQRLMGRPEALEQALAALYARHHIVFVGFSGADLNYDPNYLGLREAAAANAGFTYLAYDVNRVESSIHDLKACWGDSAVVQEGRAPDCLTELCAEVGIAVAPDRGPPVDRLAEVRAKARAWAAELGSMRTVNIASSLLRASGHEVIAGRLYWGMWRHYRSSRDCEGNAYARFNHLTGRHLLEHGFHMGSLRPPESLGISFGDSGIDRDQLDNAYTFLGRAVSMNWSLAAPHLAEAMALMGAGRKAIDLIERCLSVGAEAKNLLIVIDACIAGGTVWDIYGMWQHGVAWIEQVVPLAARFGLEPRRASLLAALVRCYSHTRRESDATEAYQTGIAITKRLGLVDTAYALHAAYGRSLVNAGRSAEAVMLQRDSVVHAAERGRLPAATRAAIDLVEAAAHARDDAAFTWAMERLEECERGYYPVAQFTFADLANVMGQREAALSHNQRARNMAKECGNEFVLRCCDEMDRELGVSAGSPG